MGKTRPKPRLDEILLAERLATEAEIKAALLRQKAEGGKFGSHVLSQRSIAEADLVRALAAQHRCKGVVLSETAIPAEVLKLIPREICLARKVMPFEFDPAGKTLKVACEDPTDQDLMRELGFVTKGMAVTLYVAAELALDTTIARCYPAQEASPIDGSSRETFGPGGQTDDGNRTGSPLTVLLVTDEDSSTPLLRSLLEMDNYRVVVSESVDDALAELSRRTPDIVFINNSVSGDSLHLVDRVRCLSPRTVIRFFGSAASLIMNPSRQANETELLLANLELFTSLLASNDGWPDNHSGRVGRYVDKLCRRLDVSEKDRIQIVNAGYLHDLARHYYSRDAIEDDREAIRLTVLLLQSVGYSPVQLDMLRAMHAAPADRDACRLPLAILGGTILTIADVFCDSAPVDEKLSLDRFEAIKRTLRGLTGTMFLPDVAEVFIGMIQEEMLDARTGGRFGQVMIYAVDPTVRRPLEMRLQTEGFRTVSHGGIKALLELYRRSEPDILLLCVAGVAGGAETLISEITAGGVKFARTPTILLTDAASTAGLTGFLDRGIEDVVTLDENLDMLMRKVLRLEQRRIANSEESHGEAEREAGARGRLADMSLADLLQALGPSRKTVCITVQADDAGRTKLRVYLSQGAIIFAESADLSGAEAIYEGLSWTDGSWLVEPVTADALPSPNNQLSNELLLMEGCRLMDERVRSGELL